jgi:hypothetical protein
VEVGEICAGARPQELSTLVNKAARQITGLFLKLMFIHIPKINVSYNLPSREWIDIILEN